MKDFLKNYKRASRIAQLLKDAKPNDGYIGDKSYSFRLENNHIEDITDEQIIELLEKRLERELTAQELKHLLISSQTSEHWNEWEYNQSDHFRWTVESEINYAQDEAGYYKDEFKPNRAIMDKHFTQCTSGYCGDYLVYYQDEDDGIKKSLEVLDEETFSIEEIVTIRMTGKDRDGNEIEKGDLESNLFELKEAIDFIIEVGGMLLRIRKYLIGYLKDYNFEEDYRGYMIEKIIDDAPQGLFETTETLKVA